MRVSKSSACRLLMPSFLKKSSSAVSCSRGTLKCSAASRNTSSVVLCKELIRLCCHKCDASAFVRYPELRQIRQSVLAFHKLSQPFFHCRSHEKITENFNLATQFIVRDGLDESFGCQRRSAIKLF